MVPSGWRISDASISSGLQQTHLLGRSQFLTSEESEALGLSGATILLDGGLFSIECYCTFSFTSMNCILYIPTMYKTEKYVYRIF